MSVSAADHYLTERVMTASPAELTAMLFDAAVGALKSALRLQAAEDHITARTRIQKAQDIVLELRSTLNHDAGPLADHLDALYTFVWTQLLQGSVQRDSKKVKAALDVLEPLQQAWQQACMTVAAA